MGDHYKVHYYNYRGKAEPLRIILSYSGADWEDVRIPTSPQKNKNVIPDEIKSKAPYGQVPLLEFNGQIISQSQTIARFLARKFNLVGANELEAARCDEIIDAVNDFCSCKSITCKISVFYDFNQVWIGLHREQGESKREELKKKITSDSKARFLAKFNEILEGNGGHFVGQSLTWADISAAYRIDNMEKLSQVPLTQEFPALQKLIQTVLSEPKIKQWIQERPQTPF